MDQNDMSRYRVGDYWLTNDGYVCKITEQYCRIKWINVEYLDKLYKFSMVHKNNLIKYLGTNEQVVRILYGKKSLGDNK